MNTYLFSIQPKWCEKIFNGEKTIEVRKTAPKPPFKVVVYCTKGNTKIYLGKDRIFHTNCAYDFETGELLENILMNGKVIGEFVCNEVENIPVDSEAFATISKPACLTIDELIEYCSGKDMYGIHITAPKLYDKPKELGEFYSIKQCKPAYSPFGYQWTWEDRHKRNTGGRKKAYRPVPIECHRCKSLVGGKDYLDEKSGCILFDYECVSKYHKPLERPPQSYMRIQDTKED